MNQNQQSQLKDLITQGKEQGFLTYAQVNDHLPDDIVDPEQIEDIVNMINDMGISVHEEAPDTDELTLNDDATTDTTPPEPTNGRPTLRFAGATFILATETDEELTFTSGDEYALASVRSLESMGLADRWQSAGQAKVKIKNSGPPGADVTITIKLPAAQPLPKLSAALASLGIEVA